MYPVSLAFVVAFHPNLKLEEIFVVRSFNHSFDQLNDVGYLLSETQYFQPIITRQFRECTETVFKNKEMVSCELKFVIVIEWKKFLMVQRAQYVIKAKFQKWEFDKMFNFQF